MLSLPLASIVLFAITAVALPEPHRVEITVQDSYEHGVVGSGHLRGSGGVHATCGVPGEFCARNEHCCTNTCDLEKRQCVLPDFQATCHYPGEPCDRNGQCCTGQCNLDTYECAVPSALHHAACHIPGEPCDRNGQCCSGKCDLDNYQCIIPDPLHHEGCHIPGEPCDRNAQCCSGKCDLDNYECKPFGGFSSAWFFWSRHG